MDRTRVLTDVEDLKSLLAKLSQGSRPNNLRASSWCVAALSGVRPVEAVVDSWPEFTALVMRTPIAAEQKADLPQDIVLYSPEVSSKALEKLLETEGVIPWNSSFFIFGLAAEYNDMMRRVASRHGGCWKTVYDEPFYPYEYDINDALTPLEIPEDLTMGTLEDKHATVVISVTLDKLTSQTDDLDLEAESTVIRHDLRNLPTAALFNASGEPVSWITTNGDLALGRGYTTPSYRGRGLYGLVLRQVARKHLQLFPQLLCPYLWIMADNTTSHRATQRCYFRVWKEQFWAWKYSPGESGEENKG